MKNMEPIILASQNQGKLKEFLAIASLYGQDKMFITKPINDDLGSTIEETGNSYLENALIKANCVYSLYHKPVIADDSGLELLEFNNIPSIFSARFAGIDATDEDNKLKLLALLKSKGLVRTPALYRCVLVFKPDEKNYFTFEGVWNGSIIIKPNGNFGFGYDPMFVPDGFDITVAQLDPVIKNKISHRAIALHKFFDFLSQT
jgi:XTP/dITP diphosphohydrolase